jgi:TonB family protein
MTNLEKDIQRYLRGEMSLAEQHALEKAALSDPFLAEALEGLSNLTETELAEDLANVSAELETQTEHVWQIPAVGTKRMAAEASASFAGEAKVASAPKHIGKTGGSWIWPLRVAALLIVLIGGYFSIPLLFNKPQEDLTVNQEKVVDSKPEAGLTLTDTTATTASKVKEEKAAVVSKPLPNAKAKTDTKPVLAQAEKDTLTQVAETELKQSEKIAAITEAPVVVAESQKSLADKIQEEIKKETVAGSRLKSTVVSENYIIQGRVLAEEDQTPLPGVNVLIKGTTTGAVTDMNGHYQVISTLPNPTLQYSFIGLQTQEVAVKQPGELNVEMKTDVSQLSEVVITGYSPAGADPNREPVIKLAQPAGGLRAYDKYLKNSLLYPQQALENNVKGRVTVSFTVHTDGTVDEFNVLKGLGFGCDEEVIRLVKDGPKWSPTTQDGEPVESEVRVRVKFAPPSR